MRNRKPLRVEALEPRRLLAIGSPVLDIDGIDYSSSRKEVPDPVGDVGRYHYIQMANGSNASLTASGAVFKVFNKSNGSVELGPTLLEDLAPASSLCSNGNGDPIVLYDQIADRWVLSEFIAPTHGHRLCVYVSKDNGPDKSNWDDPTNWHFYEFETENWPDYPKMTAWPDGYYVATNELFDDVDLDGVKDPGENPVGAAGYIFDRERMLQGQPTRTTQRAEIPDLYSAGDMFEALIPSDFDGRIAPDAGTPNFYMRHNDDEASAGANTPNEDYLEIYTFSVNWNATPAPTSQFSLLQSIPIADFDSDLCGSATSQCLASNGPKGMYPLNRVIMWRLQYRRFDDYETLVGNFTIDVGNDVGGIRWFELRNEQSVWELHQEGTITPGDGTSRAVGSIAMDGQGNIAMGYLMTGANINPDLRYTGRLANDTAGQMPFGELSLSTTSNNANIFPRWGDYTSITVDPFDDATFWLTGQYWLQNPAWSTHIAAFTIASDIEIHMGDDDDIVTVREAASDPNRIEVTIHDGTVDKVSHVYLKQDLTSISIHGNDGDDTITIDSNVDPDLSITLNGGDGKDTLTGGPGADTLIGGKDADTYFANGVFSTSSYRDTLIDAVIVEEYGVGANANTVTYSGSGYVDIEFSYDPNPFDAVSETATVHFDAFAVDGRTTTLAIQVIDKLFDVVQASGSDPQWDIDGDGDVDGHLTTNLGGQAAINPTHSDIDYFVLKVLGTNYGDANLDGIVNATDLNILGVNWQQDYGQILSSWGLADFNGDGKIDVADMNIMGIHWLWWNVVANA